jgi:DNA-binding CsgD family transcriptional regulator/PAS domain-containing protein
MDDRERLVGLIYEGVTNEEVWQELLALLGDRLNAAGTGLGLQDMATHEFRAVAEAGIDIGLHETYRRVAPENRIWQAIGRAGRRMADWMVMPKSELVDSPLYSEWFAPQGFHGVMAAPIVARKSLSGVVVAFCSRSRGDFAERDVKLLAGFAPHLGRAVSMCLEREQFLAELHAFHQLLDQAEDAVLLLNGELQVIHASIAAGALLDREDGLLLRHHRLVARHPDDDARLQAVFCPRPRLGQPVPEDFAVARRPERHPLLVEVMRFGSSGIDGPFAGAACVVRISDPEARRKFDPRVLQRLFGLTPAEARVVLEMLPPRSEDEAADRRGVTKSTFRAQHHTAYGKLSINGRDELVHLLASYGFR